MKFSLKKLNKMKYNLNPILYNRAILYFLSFLAVVDIVYFISTNDFFSLLTFVLIGILTTFFSKNMIVILVISLSITHVLKYGNSAYEGFTEGNEEEKGKEDVTTDMSENTVDKKKSTPTTIRSPSMKTASPSKSSKGDDTSSDKEFDELQKGKDEFENIGKDIMENVKKIEPLLDKAEAFINKYENYKKKV